MKHWLVKFLFLIVCILIGYYFLPEDELPSEIKIDKLVVTKSKRIMEAYSKGELIKTYKISLGKNPQGDKEFEGDKKTPEGAYAINDKNPNSGYHKNLGVSYPNSDDVKEAKMKDVKPGGEIKIHGLKNRIGFMGKFHRLFNWTAGCIAVTDQEIDKLYSSVSIGTPVIINP